jgi:hypothetical protein
MSRSLISMAGIAFGIAMVLLIGSTLSTLWFAGA